MTLGKSLEDKYVEEMKKGLNGRPLGHTTEIVMRHAYANAAVTFREIGWYEGDQSRKDKIVNALGLIEEEEETNV